MKKLTLLGLIVLALAGCRDAKSKDEPSNVGPQDFNGKGNLFENYTWYAYDPMGHTIWSNYDIYAIRSKGKYYAFEILGYYDPAVPLKSGFYTVRVKGEDNVTHEFAFDAAGCGNPHSNPNYATCIADPNQNVATYLRLSDRNVSQMPDATALTSTDWDLSFKTTAIKLNSGTFGVGDVAGALYYRNPAFFDSNGKPKLNEVQNATMSGDKHLNEFNAAKNFETLQYFVDDSNP